MDHPRGGQVNGLISIHALREEGDSPPPIKTAITSRFLSTPSARRATGSLPTRNRSPQHFYPRPPRGGRQNRLKYENTDYAISIHALREEGDRVVNVFTELPIFDFYPRPPRGGRLFCPDVLLSLFFAYFYPRPPRGGRLFSPCIISILSSISIHALREEGDACTKY